MNILFQTMLKAYCAVRQMQTLLCKLCDCVSHIVVSLYLSCWVSFLFFSPYVLKNVLPLSKSVAEFHCVIISQKSSSAADINLVGGSFRQGFCMQKNVL